MSGIGTGYDLASDTFSPDGRLFQVEYATKAVDNLGTALGLCCKDGVVVGVEKLVLSRMLVKGTNGRVMALDKHAGVAMGGFPADGRQVVNNGRREATQYREYFGVPISGKVLAERLSMFLHMHTLYWFYRPCGCSILQASYSQEEGPQLYMIDPSGSCWGYHGCAIGKGKQIAKTELEKLELGEMTCREAVKAIARIIYMVHDSTKDKLWELEMGWVCDESDRVFVPVPKDVLQEAETDAKKLADEEKAKEDAKKEKELKEKEERMAKREAEMEVDKEKV